MVLKVAIEVAKQRAFRTARAAMKPNHEQRFRVIAAHFKIDPRVAHFDMRGNRNWIRPIGRRARSDVRACSKRSAQVCREDERGPGPARAAGHFLASLSNRYDAPTSARLSSGEYHLRELAR